MSLCSPRSKGHSPDEYSTEATPSQGCIELSGTVKAVRQEQASSSDSAEGDSFDVDEYAAAADVNGGSYDNGGDDEEDDADTDVVMPPLIPSYTVYTRPNSSSALGIPRPGGLCTGRADLQKATCLSLSPRP
ncbi:hypothetical protein STEG23_030740, partial [Scotinomys teguina]